MATPPERQTIAAADVSPGIVVFHYGLAVAALFHLAGNPGLGSAGPTRAVMQALVGIVALAVLVLPRREMTFVGLCLAIPVSAWLEAPMVGNHWVLAAAVCLTYLTATGLGAVRGHRGDQVRTWSAFAPAGRIVLLTFYAFAAFSKLNSGFFDPVTSCAVYYQDQLVSSWGLSDLSAAGSTGLGRATAVGAAAVELSVPLLLAFGRTRRWGLLVALPFHWMLAMDLALHFWDFSAVLFACFLLFLDEEQTVALGSSVGRVRDRLPAFLRLFLATIGVGAAAVATASGALGQPVALRGVAVLAAHLAWWVLGTSTVVLVALAVLRASSPRRPFLKAAHPVMLVVPALVLVNGLTPYLELKTGFGWNMYSNLRTVGGETNHLVVPATWDLTGLQDDRVQVLSSSDEKLTERTGYEFVWSEFREYAHDNPGESVTYRRGGEVFSAATLSDDPATSGTVSELSRRLQSFRAVDVSGSEHCLDSFGPAR